MACPKCGFELYTSPFVMFQGCPHCLFGVKNYQMNKNDPVAYIKGLRKELDEIEIAEMVNIPKNPEDDPYYEWEEPS
jgi:predicted  nucleic acid-binding Zn-ribbon protein